MIVGQESHITLINLNTLRIFCEGEKMELNQVDAYGTGKPLDFVCKMIHYGFQNAKVMGVADKDAVTPGYETLCAHLLSDAERFKELSNQITAVIGTGQSESEKKPPAEENPLP